MPKTDETMDNAHFCPFCGKLTDVIIHNDTPNVVGVCLAHYEVLVDIRNALDWNINLPKI